MNPMAKPSGFGNKKRGYHSAHTNENRGQKTHGSFKNSGQKGGKHVAIKSVKEKMTVPGNLQVKLRMLSNNMFPAVSDVKHARHQGKA